MSSTEKITLASARDIPFNKLALSQSNVRRVKAGVSIEELAEDIARRGLLQGLVVRPVLDAKGEETGKYEVPAGGRRFRALELLVKHKRLAKTAPVPCMVRDPSTDIPAEEDSLAENVQRAPLHPLDQFRAFAAMREKGRSEEEIAAAFFTPVSVVRQRLRLAAVSPALLEVYAEDGMTLDQLMAFSVSADHARQEQVWEAVQNSWAKEPRQIRRMLTETAAPASDKRARFVGVEAYEAAGGTRMRDLFEADDGGWLEDVKLLDRLAADKLHAAADKIAQEGWKWVEAAFSFPYDAAHGMRQLLGEAVELSEEERAQVTALEAEHEKLEAEHEEDEELPDEVDRRPCGGAAKQRTGASAPGEIEAALGAFRKRPLRYDPEHMARAGAFVSIDRDGSLLVERGYIRPEDEEPAPLEGGEEGADGAAAQRPDGNDPPAAPRVVVTAGDRPSPPDPTFEDDPEDAVRPLSDRLVAELTADRTLALRDAVARNPRVAETLLLHKLALDAFHPERPAAHCLEASVRHVFFPHESEDLKDSPSAQAVAARHDAWKARIPQDEDALWAWLDALADEERVLLLAHCVSFGVNALSERAERFGAVSPEGVRRRLAQADRLARAAGLDMVAAGWRPTVGNYLGRVPKARVLEAVREAKGERTAELLGHLKKAEMAGEAERMLADSGWLPEPLRPPEDRAPQDGDAAVAALPAFLADSDENEAPTSD